MRFITAYISGLLFGLGLIVSQMVNPQKVINFLNIFSHWDGSLLFVMLSGITTFSLGYFFIIKPRDKPILTDIFFIPERTLIDSKLIVGAVIFGIGWGMTGICPGPAVTNIVSGNPKIAIFIIFMLMGMLFAKIVIKQPLKPIKTLKSKLLPSFFYKQISHK